MSEASLLWRVRCDTCAADSGLPLGEVDDDVTYHVLDHGVAEEVAYAHQGYFDQAHDQQIWQVKQGG